MSTKMFAILALVFIGLGIGGGYLIWGPRARESAQFEQLANRLEENLERSRNALERANREIALLRERQQEITGIVETAGRELSDAVERAQSITDLLRAAITVVERLETATLYGDSGPGSAAPP